jgi:hypothetical protein
MKKQIYFTLALLLAFPSVMTNDKAKGKASGAASKH